MSKPIIDICRFGLILISCANYSVVSVMFIDSRTDREEPSDLI